MFMISINLSYVNACILIYLQLLLFFLCEGVLASHLLTIVAYDLYIYNKRVKNVESKKKGSIRMEQCYLKFIKKKKKGG